MTRKPLHTDSCGGFTLVELLLVLVLVAISVAAVVPRFTGTLGAWQLRETAWNMQASLQLASQWARVRQEVVVFALDGRKGVFALRAVSTDERQAPETFPPLGRQSFGRSVRIVRTEGLQDAGQEKVLTFRPDGTSEAAIIVLGGRGADSADETTWHIVLDGRGAVRCREVLADG